MPLVRKSCLAIRVLKQPSFESKFGSMESRLVLQASLAIK